MDPLIVGGFIAILLVWHLLLTGYVYADALSHGMDARRWAAVAFLVPFFGFFAYFFERDERFAEPEPDLFVDGPYRIHHSRADDSGMEVRDREPAEDAESDELSSGRRNGETGTRSRSGVALHSPGLLRIRRDAVDEADDDSQ